jgi:serine/threonine-protein kinase
MRTLIHRAVRPVAGLRVLLVVLAFAVLPAFPAAAAPTTEVESVNETHQYYGAIALSPRTGAWGASYRYLSAGAAANRALAECRRFASDCRLAVWVRNGYASVARSVFNRAWGWAWGSNLTSVKIAARRACVRVGGIRCLTRISIHSYWGLYRGQRDTVQNEALVPNAPMGHGGGE